MLQATRVNAARAAAQAAAKAVRDKVKASADEDAAEEDGTAGQVAGDALATSMRGLVVNPHAVDALQADILPDWEQQVFWGAKTDPILPAHSRPLFKPLTATMPPLQQDLHQSLHQQQQAGGLGLQGSQPSLGMPGLSGAMSGLHAAGPLGLPPSRTGLPGALTAGLPSGSLALPGSSLPSMPPGAGKTDALGALSAQHGLQDAAAAAAMSIPDAAAAAAAASAAAGGKGKGGKGGKGSKGPSVILGKPKKPLDVALGGLKQHRNMLRLMPSIAAAAATLKAAEAVDAAAAAAAAAAATGDRAAAAALPQRWGGSKSAQGAGMDSAEAAAAAEQLRLRHVGDLLQQDLKPALADDDDWMNDIVWDAQEEAATRAGQQQRQQQLARTVSALASASGQGPVPEQQARAMQQQLRGLSAAGGRVAVLWDLNDPHMVFEATNTQQYANASAMMHPAPPQVCTGHDCRWWFGLHT